MWEVTWKDSIPTFCLPWKMNSRFLSVLGCTAHLWLVPMGECAYCTYSTKHHFLNFEKWLMKINSQENKMVKGGDLRASTGGTSGLDVMVGKLKQKASEGGISKTLNKCVEKICHLMSSWIKMPQNHLRLCHSRVVTFLSCLDKCVIFLQPIIILHELLK